VTAYWGVPDPAALQGTDAEQRRARRRASAIAAIYNEGIADRIATFGGAGGGALGVSAEDIRVRDRPE
jgi:hypothetical protein